MDKRIKHELSGVVFADDVKLYLKAQAQTMHIKKQETKPSQG